MDFFPATPKRNDELGLDQQTEMLADSLPSDSEMPAKVIEGLAVILVELVEEHTAGGIGQGFENGVHAGNYATKWLHIKSHAHRPSVVI